MHRRALLQQQDRLLAVWAVVVHEGDLLALQLVEPAFLLADVLDERVGRDPVRAEQREVPLEHAAILRFAAAVAGSDERDLVAGRLLGQREGGAGGQRLHHRRAAVLALQPLVALDAARGVVAGLAFLERQLHAVDAALRIDELQVVDVAVGPRYAVRRIRPGAVREHREELFLGLRLRERGGQQGRRAGAHQRDGESDGLQLHESLRWNVHASVQCVSDQCGNGHSRSFSLAVAQSRAMPCGSTMRKNTISAPHSMNTACETNAVPSVRPKAAPRSAGSR